MKSRESVRQLLALSLVLPLTLGYELNGQLVLGNGMVQSNTPRTPPPSPTPSPKTPIRFSLPRQGTPGNRKGTARRNECNTDNSGKTPPLYALVPVRNIGLTISQRPTFWFYVPYLPKPTSLLEFELLDSQEKLVYKNSFQLTNTPGVVSISLPPTVPPLAIDKKYHWIFSFYCNPARRVEIVAVEGYVQRAMPPENLEKDPLARLTLYAQNGIWYDTITELASLRLQNPQSDQFPAEWENLLRQSPEIQLEEIATKPIVNCCTLKTRFQVEPGNEIGR